MIDFTLLNKLYMGKSLWNKLQTTLQEAPTYVVPVVTQSDADSGYITRYFVRQTNDIDYIVEVDKLQFDKFKDNPRFLATQIRWKIVGVKKSTMTAYGINNRGVMDININEVSKADLTFGGLMRYIQDYVQFWVGER